MVNPTLPQLSIDIRGLEMIRELKINARQERKEAQSFSVLGIVTNTLQDLLDDNAGDGDVFSLIEASGKDGFLARGYSPKEVNPN